MPSRAAPWIGGVLVAFVTSGCAAMGARADGARLERMKGSLRWGHDRFHNTLPRNEPALLTAMWRAIGSSAVTRPKEPLPIVEPTTATFSNTPRKALRITWFGHSTLLIEIDGRRVLTDPVWGERASPVGWAGPTRFHPVVMPLDQLPKLDAIVISHDHYDHLDYPTIVALVAHDVPFYVPLGVGAHLEYWGVPADRIVELDWWDHADVAGLRLTATPSRHFSGRGLTDRDQTLWAGWAIAGPRHRVFFSGDTAMFPGFKDIGRRLGPFDATMIEVGAFNQLWADVHLGPEQAVEAHRMLRGRVMFPVHWGTFDLALHAWVAPIERTVTAAAKNKVRLVTPMAGETIDVDRPPAVNKWWPDVPYDDADASPVRSSGLETMRFRR